MTQGELVYLAVRDVFTTSDAVPSTKTWTDDQLKRVHDRVLLGFQTGEVNKNSGGSDEVILRKYIPGLVNNWVRKDTRLNGGVKYVPLNPGSRTGTGDEALKNLKVLLTMVTDADAKVAVQAEIDKRIEALKPKAQEINLEMIPESLRHLIKL